MPNDNTSARKDNPVGRTAKGRFAKGVSGNPTGSMGRASISVRDLARAHTETAIATLVAILTDVEAPHSARVSAAEAILNRGWGKPAQPVDGDGDGGPILWKGIVQWGDHPNG